MKLSDVMQSPAVVVDAGTSIRQCARTMENTGHGFLGVVRQNVLAGVVTGRDILTRVAAKGLSYDHTDVSAVMSSPALWLHPETEVIDALNFMLEHDIQRILVADQDGEILGVVGANDLAPHAPDHELALLMRQHKTRAGNESTADIAGYYLG